MCTCMYVYGGYIRWDVKILGFVFEDAVRPQGINVTSMCHGVFPRES